MEDVEQIVIQSLRTLACDIDENIRSLSQFSTELIVLCVSQCLKAINPNIKISGSLPPTIPARFKLGTDLAQHCKDLGFKNEISYATFLYGSPAEIRHVFLFLLEKLPKVETPQITETLGGKNLIKHKIKNKILQELNTPWLPPCCTNQVSFPYSTCKSKGIKLNLVKPRETRGFTVEDFDIPRSKLLPALLEKSDAELAREKDNRNFAACRTVPEEPTSHLTALEGHSRFALSSLLQYEEKKDKKSKPKLPPKPTRLAGDKKPEEDDEKKRDEAYRENLKHQIEEKERSCKAEEEEIHKTHKEIEQLKTEIENEETVKISEEKETEKLEKILLLVPESEAHVQRLSALLENNKIKLNQMETQWTEYRDNMEQSYRSIIEQKNKEGSWKLKEKIQVLKERLRDTVLDTEAKESRIQQLRAEISSVPETVIKRSYYTQRIMCVVQSLRKQNEEMQKVLDDVKSLQREINSLQGKVDRTFIVTDEIIFKAAKNDEAAKRVYKLLVALHSECEDILKFIDETAAVSRDSRDLEEQVEVQKRKNIGTSLQKITADLQAMREENLSLETQLRSSSE